jgi:hypothetical protein
MELLLIMVIPALVIYSVGKLVDYINPKFKGDDCYTKHLLPRKLLIFLFLALISLIAYILSK